MSRNYRHLAVQAHLGLLRFRIINLALGVLAGALLPLALHYFGVK
jgi:hypothetical protein